MAETREPNATPLDAWLARIGPAHFLSQLASLVPDAALFVVDAERRILHWSDGAGHLLGFAAEEVVGEHCLKANRCERCLSGCGLSDLRHIDGVPVTLHRKDGGPVLLHKYARAFFDESNHFLGGVELLVPQKENKPSAGPPANFRRPAGEAGGILTADSRMREVLALLERIAPTDTTVLLRGESGTGKELLARALHDKSHRRKKPFVAFNCAAMSESLLESQLFGHVRGAFTGAVRDHAGLFEQADGGTLFLDEVAEIPLDLQAKLLRVLEERTFTRVGDHRPVKVDVRIVSATHRSLRALAAAGRFREDLMYRLRVVPIFLPPLRERRGDITLLADHFLSSLNRRGPRQVSRIAPEVIRAFLDHPWRGNVRELQNVLHYAHAVGTGEELAFGDLPPEFREAVGVLPAAPSSPALDEKSAIAHALENHRGNVGEAARALGMSRATFWRRRKQLGL
ncbi:MAG: sigma-54 interaction domain-containing protein [Myxococcota bacterium]